MEVDMAGKGILIGVCGKKRSGKSTVAQYLCDEYGYEAVYFAGYLKEICSNLFGTDPTLNRPGDLSKRDREILQKVGTDFMRSIDQDCWVKYTKKVMNNLLDAGRKVVVSDVRFENEIAIIKELGGKVWHLQRDVCEHDGHTSENALANYIGYDEIFPDKDHSFGMQDLYDHIDKLMDDDYYWIMKEEK